MRRTKLAHDDHVEGAVQLIRDSACNDDTAARDAEDERVFWKPTERARKRSAGVVPIEEHHVSGPHLTVFTLPITSGCHRWTPV